MEYAKSCPLRRSDDVRRRIVEDSVKVHGHRSGDLNVGTMASLSAKRTFANEEFV
jgi:hypothetical protein